MGFGRGAGIRGNFEVAHGVNPNVSKRAEAACPEYHNPGFYSVPGRLF